MLCADNADAAVRRPPTSTPRLPTSTSSRLMRAASVASGATRNEETSTRHATIRFCLIFFDVLKSCTLPSCLQREIRATALQFQRSRSISASYHHDLSSVSRHDRRSSSRNIGMRLAAAEWLGCAAMRSLLAGGGSVLGTGDFGVTAAAARRCARSLLLARYGIATTTTSSSSTDTTTTTSSSSSGSSGGDGIADRREHGCETPSRAELSALRRPMLMREWVHHSLYHPVRVGETERQRERELVSVAWLVGEMHSKKRKQRAAGANIKTFPLATRNTHKQKQNKTDPRLLQPRHPPGRPPSRPHRLPLPGRAVRVPPAAVPPAPGTRGGLADARRDIPPLARAGAG